jgi:hypothetical protein
MWSLRRPVALKLLPSYPRADELLRAASSRRQRSAYLIVIFTCMKIRVSGGTNLSAM